MKTISTVAHAIANLFSSETTSIPSMGRAYIGNETALPVRNVADGYKFGRLAA